MLFAVLANTIVYNTSQTQIVGICLKEKFISRCTKVIRATIVSEHVTQNNISSYITANQSQTIVYYKKYFCVAYCKTVADFFTPNNVEKKETIVKRNYLLLSKSSKIKNVSNKYK